MTKHTASEWQACDGTLVWLGEAFGAIEEDMSQQLLWFTYRKNLWYCLFLSQVTNDNHPVPCAGVVDGPMISVGAVRASGKSGLAALVADTLAADPHCHAHIVWVACGSIPAEPLSQAQQQLAPLVRDAPQYGQA